MTDQADSERGAGPTGRPILSVAIATRNYGRYLPRALTSALRAGAFLGLPFEIVVADDASTDATREVLERFRLAYPDRIKAVYRTTTRGVAVAKNTAFSHCSGQYIALLDADDEFHPEKLARCYALLASGEADFVTHDFIDWRSPTDQCVRDPTTWPWGDFWPPSTWVFRNGLVWYNEQMIGDAEDLEWLARRQRKIRRRHVGIPLNIQYRHQENISYMSDSLVPAKQAMGRIQGQPHPYDRRAPMVWTCGACGRQLLVPAICCGSAAAPTPLLFYSVVESPSVASTPSPEFSLVFLTKNQVALTQRAVESLITRLGTASVELVFVDGGSTDGTMAAVGGWAASLPVKLVLIPPEEPFNYSRSCNRGARAAAGTYLLLVNNDVEVRSEGLLDALRAALADPRVGVAGVSSIWSHTQRDPEWDTDESLYIFTRRPVCGFFWGARRDLFWELGGLDETFAGYGYDELDFEYRATQAHYRLALVAGQVDHHQSATFGPIYGAEGMRPMTALNRTVFERKHGRPSYTDGDRVEPFSSHQPPGLTIVIVARDAGKMLRGTLEAAAGESRCHDGSTQLVVVDNGSQDETALVLAEHRRCLSRSLSLIRLPRPVEAPHALDIGRARAIGRVIRIAHPGDRPSF